MHIQRSWTLPVQYLAHFYPAFLPPKCPDCDRESYNILVMITMILFFEFFQRHFKYCPVSAPRTGNDHLVYVYGYNRKSRYFGAKFLYIKPSSDFLNFTHWDHVSKHIMYIPGVSQIVEPTNRPSNESYKKYWGIFKNIEQKFSQIVKKCSSHICGDWVL